MIFKKFTPIVLQMFLDSAHIRSFLSKMSQNDCHKQFFRNFILLFLLVLELVMLVLPSKIDPHFSIMADPLALCYELSPFILKRDTL